MDRRELRPLITLAMALSLAPLARAEAQMRSAVATVQLTAVVPPGASFRPALGLTVNAAYRVVVHRARGANITLIDDGRPGLVPLKAVRDRAHAAGLGDSGLPVTVDLVLDATL